MDTAHRIGERGRCCFLCGLRISGSDVDIAIRERDGTKPCHGLAGRHADTDADMAARDLRGTRVGDACIPEDSKA